MNFPADEEQGGGVRVAGHCPHHLWLLQGILQQVFSFSEVPKAKCPFSQAQSLDGECHPCLHEKVLHQETTKTFRQETTRTTPRCSPVFVFKIVSQPCAI